MRPLEELMQINAERCGISVEQNLREAIAGQNLPAHSCSSAKKPETPCRIMRSVADRDVTTVIEA